MMILVYGVVVIWIVIFAGLAFLPLLIQESPRRNVRRQLPLSRLLGLSDAVRKSEWDRKEAV